MELLLTWKIDNMSYSLLRLQLPNLEATVTLQKCTIISNFEFVILIPCMLNKGLTVPFFINFYFFDETNSKNNYHMRNCLVFNRNNFYMPSTNLSHQHSVERIDIHCKLTFGFKYIIHTLVFKCLNNLSHVTVMRKSAFCHMRTTKAQISLRFRAVWSAPLLFAAHTFAKYKLSRL